MSLFSTPAASPQTYQFPHSVSSSSETSYNSTRSRARIHSLYEDTPPHTDSSTAAKVSALINHVETTEIEYIDDLYLLFSYLHHSNPLYTIVQQLIDISSTPYLQYLSQFGDHTAQTPDIISDASKTQQWVSPISYILLSCFLFSGPFACCTFFFYHTNF